MESSQGEDTMKTAEMTTKHLEYYINLVDEAEAEYERGLTPILKVLLWVICYQTALHVTKKSFMEGSQLMWQMPLCYFKKLPQPPQPSTATILIT